LSQLVTKLFSSCLLYLIYSCPNFCLLSLEYLNHRQDYVNLGDLPRIKPKHHYLSHYSRLYKTYGPLMCVWTLRFESKHCFFKQIGQRAKNFKNFEAMAARRHQRHQEWNSAKSTHFLIIISYLLYAFCSSINYQFPHISILIRIQAHRPQLMIFSARKYPLKVRVSVNLRFDL
jgi:hypothetical protein